MQIKIRYDNHFQTVEVTEAECEKIDFIFVTATGRVTKCVIPHPGAGPTGYLSDHNPHFAHVEF